MRGKKNQMESKLGMRLSQAQGNNITVSYRGENVQEIPSVAGQTTGAKYFRKKNPWHTGKTAET